MFIDLCPGESIRVGDATLVVLDVENSRIQFAIEGVGHVPDVDGGAGWEEQGRNPTTPMSCH